MLPLFVFQLAMRQGGSWYSGDGMKLQSLTIVCFENHKSQGPGDMSSWSNSLIKNCLFMSENNRKLPNNN